MSRILEVCPEPGQAQLWLTFDDGLTRRVDLSALLTLESHRALRLPAVFSRARLHPDGAMLTWPGGAHLHADMVLHAPNGALPVTTMAVVPAAQRFRPLLPYLNHLQPTLFVREAPIEASVVQRFLQLRPQDLEVALRHSSAPAEQTLNRLYDLALLLSSYFDAQNLPGLLRRPWRYAEQQCPAQSLLHTMLGCLQYGRPDLVERPCLLLATGEA